jgi:hypothetical protein
VAQDRDQWQEFVSTKNELSGYIKRGKFVDQGSDFHLLKSTLLREIN